MHSLIKSILLNLRLQFFKKFVQAVSYRELKTQRMEGNYVDPDEMTHYEPAHLDLACLQIQLFSVLFL